MDRLTQQEDGKTFSAALSPRAEIRARMAAERAELFSSLLGLDLATLEGRPVMGDETATSILERIATQEELFTRHIRQDVGLKTAHEAIEAAKVEDGLGVTVSPFERALARCVEARSAFLDAFALVPDDHLATDAAGASSGHSIMAVVTQSYWNDASYSLRLNTWSRAEGLGESVGPLLPLLVAIRAARKELLTTVALLPSEERATELARPLEVITRLEEQFLDALSRADGRGRDRPGGSDQATSGNGQRSWERVWRELHRTHARLLDVLEGLRDDDLGGVLTGPTGAQDTIYMWARGCLLHDRMQAAALRARLGLDWPQRLLR
jgi:hypothetical protein